MSGKRGVRPTGERVKGLLASLWRMPTDPFPGSMDSDEVGIRNDRDGEGSGSEFVSSWSRVGDVHWISHPGSMMISRDCVNRTSSSTGSRHIGSRPTAFLLTTRLMAGSLRSTRWVERLVRALDTESGSGLGLDGFRPDKRLTPVPDTYVVVWLDILRRRFSGLG